MGGTNVAAALRLARKLGPGKTVVTVPPDTAERYCSARLFGEQMRSQTNGGFTAWTTANGSGRPVTA